ncbi:MAG: serine/threonine-protein kinase [Myxococcota bacterium]
MPDDVIITSGTVLGGRYRIEEVIGSGGSGTVFRATVMRHGGSVAIKLMHAGHPESDAERVRFRREAEVLQALRHRHIVALVDFGFAADPTRSPYLVFPLLAGRTLNQKLDAEAPLSWAEAGSIATQVLVALEAAHQRQITHRDIKPANIFLCPQPPSEGTTEVVKLLDFGLAKLTDPHRQSRMDVTQMGAVLGTPRYMAPEQARGERVGPAADIYSMGLVLGELVTGNPLVGAKGELDIFVAHGSDRPLPLPERLVASPFGPIVARATAKKPELRYRVATQMLADVRAALERHAVGPQATQPVPPGPDLDVTSQLPKVRPRMLSVPNEMSERLREVFNSLAHKGEKPPPLPRAEPRTPAVPSAPEPSIEVDLSGLELTDDDGSDPPAPPPRPPLPPDRPTIRMPLEAASERVSEPLALLRRRDAPPLVRWEEDDQPDEEPPG